MHDSSLEELLMGMASQLAEKEDTVLCSDVRDKLFGPNEFSRRDLGALNIMRGRDNGIPDYNTVSSFTFNYLKPTSDCLPTLLYYGLDSILIKLIN